MKVKFTFKRLFEGSHKKENHMKKALSVLVMAGFMAAASAGIAADKPADAAKPAVAAKDTTLTAKAETKKAESKAAETAPAKKAK